jgi:hypothetical protein
MMGNRNFTPSVQLKIICWPIDKAGPGLTLVAVEATGRGSQSMSCTASIAVFLDVKPSHEFMARGSVVTKTSQHSAGHHSGSVLVDSARRHASVRRPYDDGHAFRLQHLLDEVRYLGRKAFLYLQSASERIDDARQL